MVKQPQTVLLTCCGFLFFFNRPHSLYSRRSNSICKSPGPNSPKETPFISRDIGRSESLRSSNSCSHRIFRPCDLIHGEILGKGFFGQAIKVSVQQPSVPHTVIYFYHLHFQKYMCCFYPTNRWLIKPQERWWWWRSWSVVMRRPRKLSWRRFVICNRQNPSPPALHGAVIYYTHNFNTLVCVVFFIVLNVSYGLNFTYVYTDYQLEVIRVDLSLTGSVFLPNPISSGQSHAKPRSSPRSEVHRRALQGQEAQFDNRVYRGRHS